MSFEAKSAHAAAQQLRVQELVVTDADPALYDANGGNGKIKVGESLEKVLCVLVHDNSVPSVISFAQADIAISGTDIVVTGLALAANDVAIIKFIAAE